MIVALSNELYDYAGLLALISMSVTAIIVAFKLIRHVGRVHQVIMGRPAEQGVEAVPSMVERFAETNAGIAILSTQLHAVSAQVSDIDQELHPNGGQSLVDKVDRIEDNWKSAVALGETAQKDAAHAITEVAKVAAATKAASDAAATQVAAKVLADAAALAADTTATAIAEKIRTELGLAATAVAK